MTSAAASVLMMSIAACVTEESMTKTRIRDVERGLLRAVTLKGQRTERLSLEARMKFYKIPAASIAVMDRNDLEWAKAYGTGDRTDFPLVTPETIFQAGSLGRPVTTVAVLRFSEEGKLDLDRDALPRPHLPGILEGKFSGPQTIRGILTNSLGDPLQSLPEDLEGYQKERWAAVRRFLEEESGEPFAPFMTRKVFGPFGMDHSTYDIPSAPDMGGGAASGHTREGLADERKVPGPASSEVEGLWTTPSDLVRFMARLVGIARGETGGVLSVESARAMLTSQVGSRSLGFMTEGTGSDVRIEQHGRSPGFAAVLVVYPYRGQGAAVMTNSDNGQLLAEEILRSVSAVYGWPDFKPEEKTLFRLDSSIYEQYVGRYEITDSYYLDVTHEDYYLVIRPTGQAPTKFYVESQTFFFSIDPFIRIQFLSDPRGNVTGLVLWQQDFKQEGRKVG